MNITLNSTIKVNNERFIGSKIGEELMLMDLEAGDYINFNKIGALIWGKLEEVTHVNDIVSFYLINLKYLNLSVKKRP